MTETLASRVGRIISGGFNAVVDAIENALPETVMEQAIREVDCAIGEVRGELGRLLANKHLAAKRLQAEQQKFEDLEAQIATAVAQSRDDLAAAGIAQQLDIEAQVPVLQATQRESLEQEKELEGFIQALLAKKREMQSELDLFRNSQSVSGQPAGMSSVNLDARVDKASTAFDRVMSNVSGIRNLAAGIDLDRNAKLAELDELVRNNRIQERLAQFKNRESD